MKKSLCVVGAAAVGLLAVGLRAECPRQGAGRAFVRLEGPYGDRLDQMIRNHVAATKTEPLTEMFALRNAHRGHQCEFWGKYMHSAVPFWRYSGDEQIKRKIDASTESMIATQDPDGYIGNYLKDGRYRGGWDVWGMKYTLLGLIHHADGTGSEKSLKAACAIGDYLVAQFLEGRAGMALRYTGEYGGLPSCSILEPVVWLYKRTNERRYLDLATYIVREMTEFKDGPQLIAQADVPVALRTMEVSQKGKSAACMASPEAVSQWMTKAYEMMSCYQGLLEYYEVTGRKDCLEAAVKSGRHIIREEINVAGGATAGEHWFGGATNQVRNISWQQETCVTTTWMRFCQKLLDLTDDPSWADEVERSFYNAYLASLDFDARTFAAYTPLNGDRAPGHHHCLMHHNCCNANGPRGYLTVLESLLTAHDDVATMNYYFSGKAQVKIPATGKELAFRMYTLYPRENEINLMCRSAEPCACELRMRIPKFAKNARVRVNDAPLQSVAAGAYCSLRRVWKNDDTIRLYFDMPVESHVIGDYIAFTRGPVCLARDGRFGEAPLDTTIRSDRLSADVLAGFHLERAPDTSMRLCVAAPLYVGTHTEDPDNSCYPTTLRFCDYASAGNRWDQEIPYRVWFSLLHPGRTY